MICSLRVPSRGTSPLGFLRLSFPRVPSARRSPGRVFLLSLSGNLSTCGSPSPTPTSGCRKDPGMAPFPPMPGSFAEVTMHGHRQLIYKCGHRHPQEYLYLDNYHGSQIFPYVCGSCAGTPAQDPVSWPLQERQRSIMAPVNPEDITC